jgi:tetratricopeptide (TPR) repeat protein
LNNLGRLRICKGKLDEAETFLNMGIQRVDPKDIFGQYQLYRNLGWVYLERKNYDKANEYLTKAIEFDKQISKGELGKGIANCLKARVYELQDQSEKAASQWNYCLEFGKPETLHEYEAIVKINPQIGTKLDTTGVFK